MSACMAAISETGFLVPVCANAARAGNRCCLHNENPNPPTRTPKVKSRRLRRAAVFIIRWHLTSISIRKINRQEACREIALNRTRHFIRQNACRRNNQRYTVLVPTPVSYHSCSCAPESAIWTSSSHIVCFSCHRHNEFAIRDGPSANRKVPMATSPFFIERDSRNSVHVCSTRHLFPEAASLRRALVTRERPDGSSQVRRILAFRDRRP